MDMAKRKYSKRSKIEPSVQTLTFVLLQTPAGTRTTNYLDLSQIASLANRRFMRQGLNWALSGMKFTAPRREPGTGLVTSQILVSKLPNTWVLSNSWEKSMRTWSKMNREALAETESIRPKFLDFKIYADAGHHSAGYAANLLPIDINGVAASTGEWEPSKIVVPFGPASPGNTTDFELIAVGPSYPGAGASGTNAVSLIEGYASSRGLPGIRDPNVPDDARDVDGSTPENWMAAIFNEGTDQDSEVLADMFENNKAPYPYENDGVNTDTMYPGGANQLSTMQVHDLEQISATTIGGMTRVKGGNFPCGLIRIDHDVPIWAVSHGLTLQIDLVPGTHRGYLCEPMTEM